MARAVAKLVALSRDRGGAPHLRLTAAFSDGETLYAVRAASDDQAPSLWHRWSTSRQGRAVVSEPLEADQDGWLAIPAGSFCAFRGHEVDITPFDWETAVAAA